MSDMDRERKKEYIKFLKKSIEKHIKIFFFLKTFKVPAFSIYILIMATMFLYLTKRKTLKNYGKCLLFYLKHSFRSSGTQIFEIFLLLVQRFKVFIGGWKSNNYDAIK